MAPRNSKATPKWPLFIAGAFAWLEAERPASSAAPAIPQARRHIRDGRVLCSAMLSSQFVVAITRYYLGTEKRITRGIDAIDGFPVMFIGRETSFIVLSSSHSEKHAQRDALGDGHRVIG